MKTACILGGGFAGCAAAHQLEMDGGWDVTLIEASHQLGAGVRTSWHGGHPYTFGPRHFLTQCQDVWDYMNNICPLRRLEHEFRTYVESDDQFYSYPIHEDDIPRMPEAGLIRCELDALEPSHWTDCPVPQNLQEYWVQSVGPTLYRKFIDGYSRKMWQIDDNRELDTFNWSPKGVALKNGPRAGWDVAMSGYPYRYDGYDTYFTFAARGAKVLLNTKPFALQLDKRLVWIHPGDEWRKFDLIVCTISPDVTLGTILSTRGGPYGSLPYVGREFHVWVDEQEYAMPEKVFWTYYAGSEKHTRITEYKKFTGHKSPHTLLGMEIPCLNGRKDYPYPMKKWQALAKQYHDSAAEDVFFMGRIGSYRYSLDMAACVEQAFHFRQQIKSGAGRGVLGERWQ